MFRRTFLQSAALALAAGLTVPAFAQDYPDRPVRIIVPFSPGNTLDTALRLVAEDFNKSTGQPLIIESRPGGGGIVAAGLVANAEPDGYTLLLPGNSILTINPHTFDKLPYDVDKSFTHITGLLGASIVLAVNADKVASNTLGEFIDWVKAEPAGSISYASWSIGGAAHFAGAILNDRAGIDMMHVPYNGTPPAVQDLVGGQIEAAFLPLLAVKPHLESGRVKVLAVSTPNRSPLLPDVPTFAESGYPDMSIYIWSGISAPKGTPDAIIQKLNTEFRKSLNSTEIQEKFRAFDFEPLPLSTEAFDELIHQDSKRWAEAVKLTGFKAN